MNIYKYLDEKKVNHISVNSEIEDRDEMNMFISHLENEAAVEINVTFFSANMLPVDIVEKLYDVAKEKSCRIFVFKNNLYGYLTNLGIKCELVSTKHLDTRNPVRLQEISIHPEELGVFLDKIYLRYGYDYTEYHKDSLLRRIKLCMLKQNICNFKVFCEVVLKDNLVFEQLFLNLSINTTEFFRDPEVFNAIREKVLPYLDSYMHIKIWCVGCSNGKEAYSIAILLEELGLLDKAQIYATDINPYVTLEAKNGLYSIDSVDSDIINYKKSGGKRNFIDYFELKKDYIKVKSHLRKKILFFEHSLTTNGSLNEFELILCRNVMIYFNVDLQKKVLENFHNSLGKNGFLVLGRSEGLLLNGGEQYFSKYIEKEKIYKVKQT